MVICGTVDLALPPIVKNIVNRPSQEGNYTEADIWNFSAYGYYELNFVSNKLVGNQEIVVEFSNIVWRRKCFEMIESLTFQVKHLATFHPSLHSEF